MKNVLLVIGNGFDLQCDLKTRFSDYFCHLLGEDVFSKFINNKFITRDYHFVEIVNYFAKDETTIDFIKNNLFSILCLFHINKNMHNPINKINWFDIETYLHSFIKSDFFLFKLYLEDLIRELDNILPIANLKESEVKSKGKWINQKNIEILNNINKDDLLSSVEYFEWEFNDYIMNTIDCYKPLGFYFSKAKNLLHRIYEKCGLVKFFSKDNGGIHSLTTIPCFKEDDVRIYIMNFNYTNPFTQRSFKNEFYDIKKEHVTNIHGQIYNFYRFTTVHMDGTKTIKIKNLPPCILGIDDTVLKYDNKLYEFSKSYKISSRLLNIENQIHTNCSIPQDFFLPDPNDPLDIVVYGHSLNVNDYSYFHSIFDRYNLCDNHNVRIIVCYSKNLQNMKPFVNFGDVYNLIKKYGSSLLNTEQGKNLFSRLILERRLLLREV